MGWGLPKTKYKKRNVQQAINSLEQEKDHGKNRDTKSKILKSLGSKNKTLTDLSRELDLVPSTVSKHLQDLVSMGAIEQVYNPLL